jgi:DnaD/phage-associated family protein
MANPQPTDAHIRIAHEIEEHILMSMFPERPIRVMLFILRLSWGCGKHSAYIPRQKYFELCGVREGHIKQVLDWLINADVIIRDGDHYQFNKDFDRWHVSRAFNYSPEKLTELVSLNINESDRDLRELTKKVSQNLPKREETTYQRGKIPETSLASPKESIKARVKENTATSSTSSEEKLTELVSDKKPDAVPEKEAPATAAISDASSSAVYCVPVGEETIGDLIKLYEENIGLITPIIADELKDICHEYPLEWFKAAVKEACSAGARNLKYIRRILDRWRVDGYLAPKRKSEFRGNYERVPVSRPNNGQNAGKSRTQGYSPEEYRRSLEGL